MTDPNVLEPARVKEAIRAKVVDLARRLQVDATDVADDDILPATGYLDSAAILELVVWFEDAFDLPLEQEEINIDNLGSINAMTTYLLRRKG